MVIIMFMVTESTWIKDTFSHRHKDSTIHAMLK